MTTVVEKTLALIKPDAVANGNTADILQAIELAGFTIITNERVQLTPKRASEFYAEHDGKPFFKTLVNFMSSGPLVALVLAKPDAILAWRALMGPTNTLKAKESEPNSLRARFGMDGTMNATHGSDSVPSATREIRFYFPKLVLDPLPDAAAARTYVMQQLQPTLVAGFTALCKAKPTADKLETITWIAHWLLDNNPNKPRAVESEALNKARILLELEELDFGGSDEELDIDEMEQQLAATRVQAHFRGYQSRKAKANGGKQPKIVVQAHIISEQDAAATKVQSVYRGHMARKRKNSKKGVE